MNTIWTVGSQLDRSSVLEPEIRIRPFGFFVFFQRQKTGPYSPFKEAARTSRNGGILGKYREFVEKNP